MFCEQCGLQLYARESICSRCGVTTTRHWLQLVSLATLTIAIGSNLWAVLYLLPRVEATQQASSLFRSWMSLNEKISWYGWAPITLALLVWAYWPRHAYEPEKEVRLARFLLILLALGGAAHLALPFIPGGSMGGVKSLLEAYPALAPTLAWIVVVLVVGILCLNAETRDALLGSGKVLSLTALGTLFVVLMVIWLAWSATLS